MVNTEHMHSSSAERLIAWERLPKSESCLRLGDDERWQNKKDSPEPPKAVLINPPG